MSKEFSINHPLLFLLAGLVILAVLAQSVVCLRQAWKQAERLGFDRKKLKKAALSAAVLSIAPAVGVAIGLITLAGSLGLPLPWLRLSVVGAMVYELSAATSAADSLGVQMGGMLSATEFSTIAWTMTVGISAGLILIPLFCRRTLNRVNRLGEKDRAWSVYFTNALFMGLVATFVGVSLSGMTKGGSGTVKALVLVLSAALMVLCRAAGDRLGWKWMTDYALPICMVLSMAAAVPMSIWLEGGM